LNDEKQAFGKTYGTDFEDKVVLITVQVLGCAQAQALSSSRRSQSMAMKSLRKQS